VEVQLLVTCLADQLAPRVGEATVRILERLGHHVRFPEAQTCCGQPAFNDGFPDDAALLAARTFELSEFLVRVLGVTDVGARWTGRVTYHDSCHLLRELGIRDEPRRLLGAVGDLELLEMDYAEHCCGFGGAFAVKFPEVSAAILDAKLERIIATGADAVVANDTGCLIQLAGGLRRRRSAIRTLHLAEILDPGGLSAR
jgi:L-lactate dehydrogenase complex protein LldE